MPSLVTLLPFVFELSSKHHRGGGGGKMIPPTRAKVKGFILGSVSKKGAWNFGGFIKNARVFKLNKSL